MSGVPDVGVVLLAAGASSRLRGGELKQFRWIAGKPMLLHSLQLFHERVEVSGPDAETLVCGFHVLPVVLARPDRQRADFCR